jgi:hypothetical protein
MNHEMTAVRSSVQKHNNESEICQKEMTVVASMCQPKEQCLDPSPWRLSFLPQQNEPLLAGLS